MRHLPVATMNHRVGAVHRGLHTKRVREHSNLPGHIQNLEGDAFSQRFYTSFPSHDGFSAYAKAFGHLELSHCDRLTDRAHFFTSHGSQYVTYFHILQEKVTLGDIQSSVVR
ncbi:hypothetical protein [Brevundimonas lenta]|uniref:Uncharacterized protein n=1 Tax=Brevundimonas lenta TaxID=424796 RepID=A0A7W6JCS3_9CAUL|nr:hypothetical protein [Brevundimonas lenta]MBB4082661.1 hypothetical protein [Brevundimonas lenta]